MKYFLKNFLGVFIILLIIYFFSAFFLKEEIPGWALMISVLILTSLNELKHKE